MQILLLKAAQLCVDSHRLLPTAQAARSGAPTSRQNQCRNGKIHDPLDVRPLAY